MKKLVLLTALILMTGLAFGQRLQKGSIVGVHVRTITVNPGATMNQYLDYYINKYIPAYEKVFPGIKLYVTKAIRGENQNSFGLLYLIESVEVRDKYWPEPDVPSELTMEALKKIEPIRTELRKLGSATSLSTDWMIQ